MFEVSQPREPCFKLGMRMKDDQFPGAFGAARRPGAYLRIITAGTVAAGDPIEVDAAELPAIRVGSLVEEVIAPDVLRQAVDDVRVPEGWRKAAARELARR